MFLKNYTFKYPWRKYQANVLAELERHMHDDKLHVVAAPGAGKTVLGLEVIRRLNKNVLILSPTLTIKNQWVDRFLTLFVQGNPAPSFISSDIYNLDRFNVATYQGLHFAHKRRQIEETLDSSEEEDENTPTVHGAEIDYDLIAELKARDIKVIVLDEAHHLRRAWWNSLTEVLDGLEGVQTISLTATPPYDVDKAEWDRYVKLAGPIDCEISVPELVATGDLCPHQDFVIFNKLSREEERTVLDIQERFQDFADTLKSNHDFIGIIAEMPELAHYKQHEEKVLENPQYYSALLVFLNDVGGKINGRIARALGGRAPIPPQSMEWLELMLQGILFDDDELIERHPDVIEALRKDLRQIGGIERRRVVIQGDNSLKRLMASSVGKMESIVEIARREYDCLQDDLSMVILTDYIRRDALEHKDYNKIGVVPIFKRLIQSRDCPNIAILTGGLKIIPTSLIPFVTDALPECEFRDTPFEGYVSIHASDRHRSQLVGIITQAMIEKRISIIVGTAALLGQGWDCQAINSLIMASYVGSFMLSNQMRGRAIRRSKADPNKVANIWHLVSITRHDYQRRLFSKLELSDYHTLKRRFQSFVGIAYTEPLIQNGLERLNLEIRDDEKLLRQHEQINQKMYGLAQNRSETHRRWKEILALFGGEDIKIVNSMQGNIRLEGRFNTFAFVDLQRMIFGLVATAVGAIFLTAQSEGQHAGLFVWSLLGVGWQLYFIGKLIGHFNPVRNMDRVGKATLAALHDLGAIKTAPELVSNRTEKTPIQFDNHTAVNEHSTSLHGATMYENNLYIKCIEEIYSRVDNPRYLLTIKSMIRASHFNVPNLFGNNRSNADIFHKHWKKHVGKSKLIYTRNTEGRSALLRARRGSFDYNERFFERKRATRRDNWK
ncbi:MAG: DEAD/DEAH box helicase family protein [Coriobacteriia bacterium]|nr:DEAD/DEAH box helicase family protein [Coriobacteriia bacterium]